MGICQIVGVRTEDIVRLIVDVIKHLDYSIILSIDIRLLPTLLELSCKWYNAALSKNFCFHWMWRCKLWLPQRSYFPHIFLRSASGSVMHKIMAFNTTGFLRTLLFWLVTLWGHSRKLALVWLTGLISPLPIFKWRIHFLFGPADLHLLNGDVCERLSQNSQILF